MATQKPELMHITAHQSGLPQHNFAINPLDDPKAWMDRARYLKPIRGLRTGLVYSNANYAILTYLVELITGRSYYEVLDEWIFKPLNMDASSNYTELKASGAKLSQGWVRQDVNYTQCSLDYAERTSANTSTETPDESGIDALLAMVPPPSCSGVPEAFEFWTEGSGQEWGGGGNVIATGNDLVSFNLSLSRRPPSDNTRTDIYRSNG